MHGPYCFQLEILFKLTPPKINLSKEETVSCSLEIFPSKVFRILDTEEETNKLAASTQMTISNISFCALWVGCFF